jgi:hypothetical protein
VRVAVASKSRHWQWFGALRAALAPHGIDIISTWPDWPRNHDRHEPDPHEWAEHSRACIEDAATGDVLLLVAFEDERQFGALLEAGAALGAGKQVFVVSPHEWSFLKHHPRVRAFATVEAAVECLLAMASGERQRPRRQSPFSLRGV